jgi:hypothetical protein
MPIEEIRPTPEGLSLARRKLPERSHKRHLEEVSTARHSDKEYGRSIRPKTALAIPGFGAGTEMPGVLPE